MPYAMTNVGSSRRPGKYTYPGTFAILMLVASMPMAAVAGEETSPSTYDVPDFSEGYENPSQDKVGGASSATSDKAFNPAISLILSGNFETHSLDRDERILQGFQLGGEAGELTEGFSLRESELNLQANIDDKFFGLSTIAFGAEGAEVEEAYLQTLTLPAALTLKAGKFLSNVGYLNKSHPHADEFTDNPLVYDAFLGGRLSDAGVQISWLAPTSTYLNFGAELLAGEAFPAAGRDNSGQGAWTAFAKVGGDVGYSNSWLAGVSYVAVNALERPTTGEGDDPLFTGDSELWMADFVWKWAPNGNARETNFKVQAEYFSRNEEGVLDSTGLFGTVSTNYDGKQKGFYLQGIYQFAQQWRVGLRHDRLDTENRAGGGGFPATALYDAVDPLTRNSVLLEFANSEFSSIRLQFARDDSGIEPDNHVTLQYVLVMGAHGAHSF